MRHLIFFDGNHDGQLTLAETKAGLLKFKHPDGSPMFGDREAGLIARFINTGIGISTHDPGAPLTTVDIRHISAAEHGSDTGIFDKAGNFVPAGLDTMFQKYDSGNKGYLTASDLQRMRAANRTDFIGQVEHHGLLAALGALPGEVFSKGLIKAVADEAGLGTLASKGEFDLLMSVAGQEHQTGDKVEKVLTKDRLRQFYTGELWYELAGEPVPQDWSKLLPAA
ncbi:MAG: caleosin family protein [Candidatus Xenobia bacterium]